MSVISTIHDTLITKVSSVLSSDYKQLPNPYELGENNELYLTKGFGLAVGAGSRTDRLINCKASWQREFSLTLVNQITTTDHDLDKRQDIAKSLLEDHFLVFIELEKDTSLSGLVIDSKIESDSGLQFISEINRYYFIDMSLTVEYLESY